MNGMRNQCRFHIAMFLKSYFSIFRLNFAKDNDGHWVKEKGDAEVSFRIQNGETKDKFLRT